MALNYGVVLGNFGINAGVITCSFRLRQSFISVTFVQTVLLTFWMYLLKGCVERNFVRRCIIQKDEKKAMKAITNQVSQVSNKSSQDFLWLKHL